MGLCYAYFSRLVTPILDDPPALRDRMERDGYLFVRGLLPANELEALRLRFLAITRDAGWVQVDVRRLKTPSPIKTVSVSSRRLSIWTSIAGCTRCPNSTPCSIIPRSSACSKSLLDGPVLPHPRLIGRTIFPKRDSLYHAAASGLHPHSGHGGNLHRVVPASRPAADDGWIGGRRWGASGGRV